MVDAEGLARRGVRRGGVVHGVWELLLQPQIVQNEAVAVVGYAEAVRGLAIQRRRASRGTGPGLSRGSCRRQPAWRRSAGAETLPNRALISVELANSF